MVSFPPWTADFRFCRFPAFSARKCAELTGFVQLRQNRKPRSNPAQHAMRRDEQDMELATPVRHESPAVPPERRVTDGDLLQRIADGDTAAFDILYRRFSRPVYGLALRMLRDRGRAEEAVQETFAAIWRSAASYRSDRGPGAPWLYAVARNAIVDRTRVRGEATFADPPEIVSSDAGPDEQVQSSYVSWRVHRAVQDLPQHEREVLELAYWGGLSQSEVARFLDIPLGTVKTRTRSALARLSDLLEGEFR
jgi:RNA polymerase sigma-70 factor (ECF subfamily)